MKQLLLTLCMAAAIAQTPDALLGSALHQERVAGNLQAAIDGYKKVLAAKGVSRATAAQAQYHIGLCYERLGNQEARKAFEAVVKNYADQQVIAGQARARLAPAAASGERAVWTGPAVDIFGRISGDGRYLTYVDWDKTGNLMLHDMTTGEDFSLTGKKSWDDPVSGSAGYSTISPDGKQIAHLWDNELRLTAFTTAPIANFRILSKIVERPFDWSPDGRLIAVHVREGQKFSVGVLSVADGSYRKLNDATYAGPRNMVFSKDGRHLVYDLREAKTPEYLDIYASAVDGSSTQTLLNSAADERVVGFSADGKQLLYTSNLNRTVDLWAQPFNSGKLEGTARNLKADFGRVWIQGVAADGTIYATRSIRGKDMYVAPLDLTVGKLTGPAKALNAFPYRGWPAWNAAGTELAMVDCAQFGAEGCLIQVWSKQSGSVRAIRHGLMYVNYPTWTSDGGAMVTGGRDYDGNNAIYQVNAADGAYRSVGTPNARFGLWRTDSEGRMLQIGAGGSEFPVSEIDLASGVRKELSRIPRSVLRPGISPDGKTIAFVGRQGEILTTPTTGGAPKQIGRLPVAPARGAIGALDWTQNGRGIFISIIGPQPAGAQFWLATMDGAVKRLDIDTRGWEAPFNGSIAVSPDGTQIAFQMGSNHSEVWAIAANLPKP